MNVVSILHNFFRTYKSYSSAILAVASGLGMILSKNFAAGFSDAFQAMMIVFGGASLVELRHAVATGFSKSPTSK
jgi:hypothetical protein